MNKLFSDLKTDEEKSNFFLSGRGYETGVIAPAIQNDVAMAYHRCAEYAKEVQALGDALKQYVGIASELATENEKMRVALEMIAGVRPCPDSLMGNADIARATLSAMEKQK